MRLKFLLLVLLLTGCAMPHSEAGETGSSQESVAGDAALIELGRVTFRSAGCVACHRREGLGGTDGPDLDALAGTSDPTYVRESILEPKARILPGYEGIEMPGNYGEMLSEPEIDALQYYLSNRLK
ncbi:MAG: c-type cytochrome [Chrysiogenetes bacterium]|nr:c-type cytochrome [Chrysiogenetes bacterium]